MEDLLSKEFFLQENIFELFKAQLRKDFETAGLKTEFISNLKMEFMALKTIILNELKPLFAANSSSLSNLLYRIDISELQIKKYQKTNPKMDFEEVITELVIKRTLQKVILKKKFSNG